MGIRVGRDIRPEDILKGPFWPEMVRVISVKPIGNNQTRIEAVGTTTHRFYNPILAPQDLGLIEVVSESGFTFSGDAESLFLFLESHRIRNAFQFDPLYAVNVSQIDPLPHQIDGVYHHILPNPRIRFLLADDPGAGKTIMAGLLLKELKYRGLVDRTLIVVPGHLKDQWHREMKEKFQENFMVVDRGSMSAAWGQNLFTDLNQVIVSMDFAKQDDIMKALSESRWDLCISDESHKMAAYRYGDKIDKTQRYNLGELLSGITGHLLLLTATPHRGDPENFRLLLDLLEPGFFADTKMLAESIKNQDNPLFLRRLKEDLKDFDGTPLFPPRNVETIKYSLSEDEKVLYRAVTEYVEKHFNRALQTENRNVTFALTVLQRRLASSTRAIRKSLERRHTGLEKLHRAGQLMQEVGYGEDIEDLEETERLRIEEELLQKLTSAGTLDELKDEIERLEELVKLAREVEKMEIETKLIQLKKVMEQEGIQATKIKLLIFTESRDTLEYLVEKLQKWGYAVTFIHGGMNLDQRIQAEADFRNISQIMVSTEAGGEGINLQFCWLMVNYDIPWNPNRLEQRMGRIHRYGQQHEVHIYNLVAVDTIEGRILEKLFEKLELIRQHLGSDRVFDVMGNILMGKNLKDLIMDAIANIRTMEDILKEFDRVLDVEAVERTRDASLEALATRHIDLSKVLGEQRKAKENRLVPEYVEEFFKRASKSLGIKLEARQDGFWRVPSVPPEVRNQSHAFKLKFGDVQREYIRIGFDKEKTFKGQAEFVAMGHPLLEAAVSTILSRFEQVGREGATFADPNGQLDGVLWYLEAEIRDGSGDIAGKRLFTIYQPNSGDTRFVNPAILWDLKPSDGQSSNDATPDTSIIVSFGVQGLEQYRTELLERRKKDAEIKRKYGVKSLDSMILDSQAKLTDYETRRFKGENIPDAVIYNENRKQEDLGRKKERLLRGIEAETHLYPTEPRIVGAIRVVPKGDLLRGEEPGMVPDKEIETRGMEVVMEFERNQGREPSDVSKDDLGYDIKSTDTKGIFRYIEVKARAGVGPVAISRNEWFMAQRLKDEYWLYVVVNVASTPELFVVQNPAEKLEPEEVVSIVKFIVKDWKTKGKMEWKSAS
jgi:superfamily II DNA or RNA helicase